MMTDRDARMALAATMEPGRADVAAAVSRSGPEELWERVRCGDFGGPAQSRAQGYSRERTEAAMARHSVRFLVPSDAEWPAGLGALDSVEAAGVGGEPLGLWARGPGVPAGSPGVAIVGARAATAYGEELAAMLAAGLADRGHVIVSGGAYGIDAAAHRATLAADRPTILVAAGGLACAYPAGLSDVFEAICQTGLVLSEYPCGEPPRRSRFLTRNRLIAAVAAGTIMVQATLRSGARNTVSWAQRCGRIVMACPGAVHLPQSEGPHRLIRDAEASLVTTVEEAAALLEPISQATLFDAEGVARVVDGLTPEQNQVWDAMPSRGRVSPAELSLAADLPIATVVAALSQLQERGLIREADGLWTLSQIRADHQVRGRQPARLIPGAEQPRDEAPVKST